MQGLRRTYIGMVGVGLLLGGSLLFARPAWAGGGLGGANNRANAHAAGHTIGVTVSTHSGTSGSAGGQPGGHHNTAPAAATGPAASSPPRCTYEAVSPAQMAAAGLQAHAGRGYWASVFCTSGSAAATTYVHTYARGANGSAYNVTGFTYTWIPTARSGHTAPAAGTAPAPSPLQVAQLAEARAHLPSPGRLHFSPDHLDGVGPLTIVNYPTWLWIGPGIWHQVSATASVARVAATVRAVPTAVTWDMGDGGSVTCDGPGLPWTPGATGSPCSYSYRRAAKSLRVTATVTWTVRWVSSAGQAGTFPSLTTSASAPLGVTQVESVITSG